MTGHLPAAPAAAVVPPTSLVRPRRPRMRVMPVYAAILIAFHAAALLAFLPYCFTWWGIPVVLLGNAVFGSVGINLAYHRLLTHRSLIVPAWLEKLFIVCGVCSLEGPPIKWVAVHRIHHKESDEADDPHSPHEDFFWGHMGWIYSEDPRFKTGDTYARFVPDLLTDKFMRWLHKKNRWVKIYVAHAVSIVALGFLLGLALYGTFADAIHVMVLAFVWGLVVRTVYVWHITWFVNSASHRWGYRNYETDDKSRNNWWVALLTNGEGWHNNHHAAPRSASHGHRWWELDLTYTFIRSLELVGLAKKVVPVKVASYRNTLAEPVVPGR